MKNNKKYVTQFAKTAVMLWVVILIVGCTQPTNNEPQSYLIEDCVDSNEIHVICGLPAPEDLAVIPDSPHLIVSQFGGMDGKKGSLILFDTIEETFKTLISEANLPMQIAAENIWGNAQCSAKGLSRISPHGIDVHTRADGSVALLVVNHNAQDSIEMFELNGQPDNIQLSWRGCVAFSEKEMLNDVVGNSDGGFFTTNMFDKTEPIIDGLGRTLRLAFDELYNSGEVWQWKPEQGLLKMMGTASPAPNGIEASENGAIAYINVYPRSEVWKLDVATGEKLGIAKVVGPDNIAWGDDGLLYVASHDPHFHGETTACHGTEKGACGYPFHIVTIDPDTMESRTVFSHQGAPFGAATIALRTGGSVYMGSFAGSRIAKISVGLLAP